MSICGDGPARGCHGIFAIHHLSIEACGTPAGGLGAACPPAHPSDLWTAGGARGRHHARLNDLGIGRNDRVAMVLPNGPEMAWPSCPSPVRRRVPP